MAKRLKTAVIGTGFMGRVHLEQLQRVEGVDVVAVARRELVNNVEWSGLRKTNHLGVLELPERLFVFRCDHRCRTWKMRHVTAAFCLPKTVGG
jgi:hypothetical protein